MSCFASAASTVRRGTGALDRLRRGAARSRPGRWMNFVHRDDAAGALEHLMQLETPERVYLGVDKAPVESEVFHRWLAERAGVAAPPVDTVSYGKNKRCSSVTLSASGYVFQYPTFRHGYRELLGTPALAPCPPSPNCVSSRATDDRHRTSPLQFRGSVREARDAIAETLRALGGVIVIHHDDYVRAQFTSRVFGFIDDVECAIDAAEARVDLRSASRVGFSDFGANRRRIGAIVDRLTLDKKRFSVDGSSVGT